VNAKVFVGTCRKLWIPSRRFCICGLTPGTSRGPCILLLEGGGGTERKHTQYFSLTNRTKNRSIS
jgi:hypothetical protein